MLEGAIRHVQLAVLCIQLHAWSALHSAQVRKAALWP